MSVVTSFLNADDLYGYIIISTLRDNVFYVDSYQDLILYDTVDTRYSIVRKIVEDNLNDDQIKALLENDEFSFAEDIVAQYQQRYELIKNQKIELLIFPYSKTAFRREIYGHLPDSLYRKMYDSMKTNGIIEKATGQYVITRREPLTIDQKINAVYSDVLSINSSFSPKALGEILQSQLTDMSMDIVYYLKYIEDLMQQIDTLKEENFNLSQKIQNNTLTSWY